MVANALQSIRPVVPETAQGAQEKRGDRRMRVFKSARIVFNGGFSAQDCRVKNLSLSGALLEMASVVGVPNQFELQLDGVQRSSIVVWRNDRFMGVVFSTRGPAPVGR